MQESAATEIPGDSSSASTDGLPESTADNGEHEAELQARREEVCRRDGLVHLHKLVQDLPT